VIDLGLGRTFTWSFVDSDVREWYIGLDFLRHFGLIVDLNSNLLRDPQQGSHVSFTPFKHVKSDFNAIVKYNIVEPYLSLVNEYSNLTVADLASLPQPKHSVVHHIDSSGPPRSERPR
jgi:hypothetical protein